MSENPQKKRKRTKGERKMSIRKSKTHGIKKKKSNKKKPTLGKSPGKTGGKASKFFKKLKN